MIAGMLVLAFFVACGMVALGWYSLKADEADNEAKK